MMMNYFSFQVARHSMSEGINAAALHFFRNWTCLLVTTESPPIKWVAQFWS